MKNLREVIMLSRLNDFDLLLLLTVPSLVRNKEKEKV